MCPKLANLLEIFISKFTESINTEQAIFLDYFSAEQGSSHCHPLLLSMTSRSKELTPILPSAQTAFAVLVGMCSIMGTMFALGPMEEGFFSLPQRAAAVSLCLLAAIRAGDWSEHICCIGWYDRKVSSHSGINSPSRTSKRPQTNKL